MDRDYDSGANLASLTSSLLVFLYCLFFCLLSGTECTTSRGVREKAGKDRGDKVKNKGKKKRKKGKETGLSYSDAVHPFYF